MWTYEILQRYGRNLVVFRFEGQAWGQSSAPDDTVLNELLVLLEQAGLQKYKDETK